ncbi:cyclic AMP-responsive element-binding protein 3-like protein 4 [Nematostella vectensis]|uniref:cyclic AMP-responsive element-binding protein 3-like protein 4 n=1 Tax=Nematostella vectensis TaxID=45351 RepID=UPI0020772AEA|nr:cyclic AMP-responsive element-binding protein 3-like protein 4 [Nematostella vectensis]
MVVESIRSTVALDHLYAKPEEELVDLEKDASLKETIANLAELTDDELIKLFFNANTAADDNLNLHPVGEDFANLSADIDNTSFSSADVDETPSLSPCSDSTASDSFLTSSPEGMDFDINSDMVSTTSSEGILHTTDDFAIDVGYDWLSELQQDPPRSTTVNTLQTTSTSINVVNEPTVTSSQPTMTPTTYSSLRNGSKLVLTEEEKKLLAQEGVELPTDVSLTKAEERVLKKVRRKIKNKQSAQESRKKKKDYVDGLEMRVKVCTEKNTSLQKKVDNLEKQNSTLMDQLKQLQAIVAATHPTKTQTGTCLMVLILAFGLVIFPMNGINTAPTAKDAVASYASINVRSRTLLQVRDEAHDDTVNPPATSANGSEAYQALELDWDAEQKDPHLADLSFNLRNNEESQTQVKEKTPMRTERK